MNDVINRKDAIGAILSIGHIAELRDGDAVIRVSAVNYVLRNLPSADVQPVRHGHWIIKDNPGTGWYRVTCSECGEDVTSVAPVIGFFPNARVTWDFCPNCGADMRGKQNG